MIKTNEPKWSAVQPDSAEHLREQFKKEKLDKHWARLADEEFVGNTKKNSRFLVASLLGMTIAASFSAAR